MFQTMITNFLPIVALINKGETKTVTLSWHGYSVKKY